MAADTRSRKASVSRCPIRSKALRLIPWQMSWCTWVGELQDIRELTALRNGHRRPGPPGHGTAAPSRAPGLGGPRGWVAQRRRRLASAARPAVRQRALVRSRRLRQVTAARSRRAVGGLVTAARSRRLGGARRRGGPLMMGSGSDFRVGASTTANALWPPNAIALPTSCFLHFAFLRFCVSRFRAAR